jgi:uncharacterized protein (TIGR03086 family)
MSDVADRYRRVAAGFTERVNAVPDDAWDNPAPCEGWVARDVVGHMVEWMPSLLATGAGIRLPGGPSVEEDPAAAWIEMSDAIQAVLDDPSVSAQPFSHEQAGEHRVDDAIGMFIVGDILVHTWDLARATGLDERLDADEMTAMYEGMEPLDAMLRASGQYGPRVLVPDTADVQTKLIAFSGRQP